MQQIVDNLMGNGKAWKLILWMKMILNIPKTHHPENENK